MFDHIDVIFIFLAQWRAKQAELYGHAALDAMSPVHLPVGVLHNYLLIIASLTELITVNSLGMMLEPAQLFAAQAIVLQTKKNTIQKQTADSCGFITLTRRTDSDKPKHLH